MCLSAGWALGCWPPQTELEFSFGNAISYLASPKEGYGEEAQTQTSGFENIHLLQTSKTSFLEQPVHGPARHIYMVNPSLRHQPIMTRFELTNCTSVALGWDWAGAQNKEEEVDRRVGTR